MKVLMIAPTPFFADRGCHIRIYEEVMGLQSLGHEVLVCTYGLGRDVDGVKTIRTINFPWYHKLSAGPSKTKILLLPFLLLTTLRTIRIFKPDVIHAHLHEGACIARVCRLFYPRKKYLFDMQGGLVQETVQHGFVKEKGLGYIFLSKLEKAITKWQFIIVSSRNMEEELNEMGLQKKRYLNVMDGVDIELFRPEKPDEDLVKRYGLSEKSFCLVFVGLLEEYQGIDILLDAFKLVLDTIPEAVLIICGYPNEDYYKNKCKNLGILNKVHFVGRVEYLDLHRYLSLGQIAIAPKISVTEGNGKIYNYLAMGLPTIAFNTEVNREIMGDAGLYVEEKSDVTLANKIIWAYNNQDYCKNVCKMARKRAENKLSNIMMARKIERVYRRL
ncbi:MAG: glycosyltransferase family 4 protein [Lachnospiraceae bacterium]|nr:glycosyltransferase family 4 protein [Lachnospiraceae bacterium]